MDQHGLDVDELVDAEVGAFAAVAGMFDPAERMGGSERTLRSQSSCRPAALGGDPFAADEVGGQHAGAQAELGVVGDADGQRLPFGLGSGVLTRDLARGERIAARSRWRPA